MRGTKRRQTRVLTGLQLGILAVLVMAVLPATALGAARAKLAEIPAALASPGAGQLNNPQGGAVNRTGAGGVTAGDYYVADRGNNRISQFSSSGSFVRAFGLNVGGAGVNACTVTCQAGTASAAAGSVNAPLGVAVDQATGNVFVFGLNNRRIDVFSAIGVFEGAFGWAVKAGVESASELQFCTAGGTGCQAGESTAAAGGFATNATNTRTIAVDSAGQLFVPNPGSARLDVFLPTLNGSKEVVGATFVRGIGWDVIPVGGAGDVGAGLETCTVASTCQQGSFGGGEGQFSTNNPVSVDVDASGSFYTVDAKVTGNCEAGAPCRVQKFNADGTFGSFFGPASGSCQLNFTGGVAMNQQTLAVAVDPATQNLLALKKVGEKVMRVCELSSSGAEVAIFPSTGLTSHVVAAPQLRGGIAIGLGEKVFVTNGNPGVYILGPIPPPSCSEILPVTEVGQSGAKLNGKVCVPAPGGEGFDTTYHFELSADEGESWTNIPAADVSVGSVAGSYEVHQVVGGLQPNRRYRVRIVATTSSSVTSGEVQFKTAAGAPSVRYALGTNALTDPVDPFGPTSVELAGYVNPNNADTTYRFEYGLTTAYGLTSPAEFEPFLGSGGAEVPVRATLTGLQPDTTYHFRIVATNSVGTTKGADKQFTTAQAREVLNAYGLPGSRGFELVSPRDQGPVSEGGGEVAVRQELQFQAATDGSKLAYVQAYGLPESTSGGEVVYRGARGSTGWSATQLSPPLVETSVISGSSIGSRTMYLADDVKCGVFASGQPLTADAPTGVIDAGGVNLFRWTESGGYTIVTRRTPSNPEPADKLDPYLSYRVIGASESCDRIVFETGYQYPGISSTGLVEWDHGVLRNAASVPAPSGEASAGVASPGGGVSEGIGGVQRGDSENLFRNALATADGVWRLVFTAGRQKADGPAGSAEAGRTAIFVREDGASTVDVSKSETATPSLGAFYQTASADGTKVFFLANYGLTSTTSAGPKTTNCAAVDAPAFKSPCDLYEYDSQKPAGTRLTDLSATTSPSNPDGAMVAGVLDSSDDGAYVYFAAKGQLLSGQGNSYAQNSTGTGGYNIYLVHAGQLTFVASVAASDITDFNGVIGSLISSPIPFSRPTWSARATPDGEVLLFQARSPVTGYDSGQVAEAYRFSAKSESTVCITCRRDGAPSVADSDTFPLPRKKEGNSNFLNSPQALSADGSRVFFSMPDALAAGAVDGNVNLYMWQKGQIYLIATGSPTSGVPSPEFMGSDEDGSDLFFSTSKKLTFEDTDERRSVYDARIGGGSSPPPPPAAPCNPLLESACQEPGSVPPGAQPPPSSSTLAGPGNETPVKAKKKKKNAKKKSKQQKKQKGKGKRRGASKIGRAAK
jgi:hypothetical protein